MATTTPSICYCPEGHPYHLLPGTVCATFRVGYDGSWELNWLHPSEEDGEQGIKELIQQGWDEEETYFTMPA
jgi:hypothetical protein